MTAPSFWVPCVAVPAGASLDQPGSTEADVPAAPALEQSLLKLIWSDYERFMDLGGEDHRSGLLKAPIRFAINTSLRAQVLVRLTCASPRWLHWLFRSLLNLLHSSEVVYGARIGPRMHLPHPYGIGIGGQVRIGSDVTLNQHVTLGSNIGANGQPELGDNVNVLAGAMIAGPIRVGHGAVVGANCVLEEDLPDGGLAAPARTRIVRRRIKWEEMG